MNNVGPEGLNRLLEIAAVELHYGFARRTRVHAHECFDRQPAAEHPADLGIDIRLR